MKTQKMTWLLFLLILSVGFAKQDVTDSDKKKALQSYTVCRQIADEWLPKLDSSNYSLLSSIQPIQPVDNDLLSSYINEVRKIYGRVTDRKFIGSHIWSNKILLTYAPDIDANYLSYINAERSKDGFYVVQPRYFGLESHSQMFEGFPSGDYVILMFKVLPSNKDNAEEKLTLWHNPNGNWQVVGYKIADDI
jgi:hypothetical protein